MAKPFSLWLLQKLPNRWLSRVVGRIAQITLPKFLRIPLFDFYINKYQVNRDEIPFPLEEFPSFHAFFSRPLPNNIRPLASGENVIVSPVDGKISHFGEIRQGLMLQFKGKTFYLEELFSQSELAKPFINGFYTTIYLHPSDYHRIHSPCKGKIDSFDYVAGSLLPVNEGSVAHINRLFTSNERVTTFIDTGKGRIALIKIGATCVGSISLSYESRFIPNPIGGRQFKPVKGEYQNLPKTMNKGQELARFNLGSTVIVLFEKDKFTLRVLEYNQRIKMGEALAFFK